MLQRFERVEEAGEHRMGSEYCALRARGIHLGFKARTKVLEKGGHGSVGEEFIRSVQPRFAPLKIRVLDRFGQLLDLGQSG